MPTRPLCVPAVALILGLVASCGDQGEIIYDELQSEITVGVVSLPYSLLVPHISDGRSGWPMIIALHSAGVHSPTAGRDFLATLVRPALGGLGALMAAPHCPQGMTWVHQEVDSAVIALIDTLNALYRIDPERILVTGYSMGGSGAWHLAAHHPELLSASIPVSGPPDPRDVDLLRGVPIVVIHSDADGMFPLAMIQETVNLLQFRGVPVTLHVVHDLSHDDIEGFVPPLTETAPWIRALWGLTPIYHPAWSPIAPSPV